MPIIVTHFGDHPYVLACLRETAKHNRDIYLIGDESNAFLSRKVPTLRWIDHLTLPLSAQALAVERYFVNYSTNSHEFEFTSFLRMFYAQSLLDLLSCDVCFHLDSDCALLAKVDSVRFCAANALAVYSDFGNRLRMAASVHNARLTRHYLRRFSELSEEIYVRGTGFNLIADKICFHRDNRIDGGICDMTLHYILSREMHAQNLGRPLDGHVFDYRFGTGEGDELQQQYAVDQEHKVLYRHHDGIYIEDLRGIMIKLLSIHFQGDAKKFVGVLDGRHAEIVPPNRS